MKFSLPNPYSLINMFVKRQAPEHCLIYNMPWQMTLTLTNQIALTLTFHLTMYKICHLYMYFKSYDQG